MEEHPWWGRKWKEIVRRETERERETKQSNIRLNECVCVGIEGVYVFACIPGCACAGAFVRFLCKAAGMSGKLIVLFAYSNSIKQLCWAGGETVTVWICDRQADSSWAVGEPVRKHHQPLAFTIKHTHNAVVEKNLHVTQRHAWNSHKHTKHWFAHRFTLTDNK